MTTLANKLLAQQRRERAALLKHLQAYNRLVERYNERRYRRSFERFLFVAEIKPSAVIDSFERNVFK